MSDQDDTQTCADLIVKCLINEGVKHIFALPGEENADLCIALTKQDEMKVHIVRHEQGGAFMASGYARASGIPAVVLGTLGPGATNMLTGVADAHFDRVPIIAITGQGATTRIHKESHQIMDVVGMFEHITKWASPIRSPETAVEVVRKCFKLATTEKPGATHMELYEDIAKRKCSKSLAPMTIQKMRRPVPDEKVISRAWEAIKNAKQPVILAGNGSVRKQASKQLKQFTKSTGICVMNTFMAKGCIPLDYETCLFTVGLQGGDYNNKVLEKSDLIITIGYDMSEYHPFLWNKGKDKKIIHIDFVPAEIDEHYDVHVEVVGEPAHTLWMLNELQEKDKIYHDPKKWGRVREYFIKDFEEHKDDTQEGSIRPQKFLYDLRQVLKPDDILYSDVGAHKMWIARYFQCYEPNTCFISNGFCSMGQALPGSIGASIAHPEKKIFSISGDGGFMMNVQEMETAVRLKSNICCIVWDDCDYGLITWKQQNQFGTHMDMTFSNPKWSTLAEAFGWKHFSITNSADVRPTLEKVYNIEGPVLVSVPIDYRENLLLTKKLGSIQVSL